MNVPFGAKHRRNPQGAQTLVFFLIAWGAIMLLCGLAIDSGLLYLAKARLGRAVDGAALAAVGNFNQSSNASTNRDDVAAIMRNFAVANYTDLSPIAASITGGGTPTSTIASNGQTQTSYIYNFNDGSQDANGQFRRFVQVTLNTGSNGNITSATCNARCPVQTYFIGYGYYFVGNGQSKQYAKIGGYSGPTSLVDLKVSSSAVATRNPRLIEIVIDRSASMLANQGGASGLPPAIVQFLDFFDTSSDNIGIVSFGTAARVEMPITTNFLIAGTNNLIDAYNTETNSPDPNATTPFGVPGMDPEIGTDPGYATNGVRRLKFGGSTCADDGIRLGLEQMMANGGFNDPDVVKYLVIFTDGKWNTARTLFAAPGYTNIVTAPTAAQLLSVSPYTSFNLTNANALSVGNGNETNAAGQPAWSVGIYTNATETNTVGNDTNLVPMPTLSPLPYVTNAMADTNYYNFASLKWEHTNDVWLSADGTSNETLETPNTTITGAPKSVTNTTWVATAGSGANTTNYYTPWVDVWLQPGAVAYHYSSVGAIVGTYVSEYTNPTKEVAVKLGVGEYVTLVVPGYIVDGTFYDGLDLTIPDDVTYQTGSGYPKYRADNFQTPFTWADDPYSVAGSANNSNYMSGSIERALMFRNYANLLTGFYVSKPDYPNGSGTEPLITEQNPPGAPRPLFGLGPYYPGAPFYWPFGGETNASGYVTNAVGLAYDPTYALINPADDPDTDQTYNIGGSRHNAYSINMLSPMAAPEWAGELFYDSVSGGGTNTTSGLGSASASQIMQSGDWQNSLPSFASVFTTLSGAMTNEPNHNSTIAGSPSVWRPLSFNGSNYELAGLGSVTPGASVTGGYVADGPQGGANTHYYKNAMAWSGRPTHYFDFSKSKWEPIADNHNTNIQALPLGNWKAWEYAWHARALGVTIYTVGYGSLVTPTQQAYLAQLANATNTTAGGGTAISYNPSQPIGQEFYATNATQISNDFYSVGQAINEALTGGN
jgi:Flp pilus assembly protein TadG